MNGKADQTDLLPSLLQNSVNVGTFGDVSRSKMEFAVN